MSSKKAETTCEVCGEADFLGWGDICDACDAQSNNLALDPPEMARRILAIERKLSAIGGQAPQPC